VNTSSFNFAGKVALVTGGSSGIGKATSLLFAQHGAKVVIGDNNPAGVETVEMIKREQGDAIFVQTDVSVADQVRNLVATAVTTYGGLHYAFNNAGVAPPMALLADTDESTFDEIVAVDMKGVFLAMKYEIQQMLQTGGGAIVNNASIAGLIAEPGISSYIAAKHGVIGLSKAAAVEYANQGIRINALAPGLVNTAMTKAWFDDPNMSAHFIANTPIGRVSQPAEMAGMVLFLCSDFASFAVGQTFVIDGGYTTH
jgi:NAD(P)-dependent dehydrogenase (short-subunit alcohol dehydrogenase family)